jgi:hypothetical protein
MTMSLEAAAQAMREAMRETVKRHSLWYLIRGALMVLGGALALVYPIVSSVAVVLFLGWVLIISGMVQGISLIGAHVGEPGLGKSRLIEEFHARLRETPHTWVGWSCSQLLQNTPLHPIAEWGRQRFGGADVPAERRLADLENTLTLIKLDPAENVPFLAPLLDMPLPKERILTLPPEELRLRQFAALTAWTIASARSWP